MKKLKDSIFCLGLNFKKEVTVCTIINAIIMTIFIVLIVIFGHLFLIMILLIILSIFNFIYFNRYSLLKKRLESQRLHDFVSLFTYFNIYINNGINIYTALQYICDFSSTYIKEKMELLLFEIDNDKSVSPFIHFAKNFNSLLIEQMMLSVYQMIDQGNEGSYLMQFQTIFAKISDEEHRKEIFEKTRKIDSLSAAPLIGAGMITIIITIGLVTIIGGIINGL